MSRLSTAQRVQVVSALVEGNSVRSTCRMTGIAKGTVLSLLADLGKVCADYHDEHVRNVAAGPENREASRLYLRRGDLSRAVRYRASEESGTVRQVTGKVSPVSGDLQREELSGAGATAGIQSGRRQAAPYVVEGPGGFTRYSPIRAGFVFRPDPDCQSKPTLTPCSLPGVMVLVRRQPAHQSMSLDNIDLAP